ncbi:hypothetical protein [Bradyrhizobium sp. NAS96.2]|uniref:hypothetical protein n=1 Tax=Bradyrhizobium sp. NAS96.2 TaxID=1680160 RepID=UPI00093BB210|nr:hypothetical protein [Bradyrhizobium sp. NAS96.2]OKO67373.1 hypothetical protein AC628_39395 [Bradyrhizobium sp. NAS96.2]
MNTIAEDLTGVIDLADLLAILLAQPDAETAIDGMHKAAQIIGEHARSIQDQLGRQATPAPALTLSVVHRLEPSDRA